MTVEISQTQKDWAQSLNVLRFLQKVFFRLLAIIFFSATIFIWMQAIGIWEGPQNRFDTMESTLKIYTAVMAVILPVTSVGLWTTLPWGWVVWFIVISFQSVTMMRFPQLFEWPNLTVFLHCLSLVIFTAFQIALSVIAKKE